MVSYIFGDSGQSRDSGTFLLLIVEGVGFSFVLVRYFSHLPRHFTVLKPHFL